VDIQEIFTQFWGENNDLCNDDDDDVCLYKLQTSGVKKDAPYVPIQTSQKGISTKKHQ
jgi:hypothetical protein